MIINFSVQNFGSIKDKQTLSFEADKSKHLKDYYVVHTNGLHLLKLGLIYGANASGKTTILKALDFLRHIVLEPNIDKDKPFDFEPFSFDKDTPNQNTIFSIEFIQNDVIYNYEVELNKKAIVREILQKGHLKKTIIVERTTDLTKQLTNLSFGKQIKIDAVFEKTLTSNTLWNDTVIGGFSKTNIDLKELKDVKDWFSSYLRRLVDMKPSITNMFPDSFIYQIFDLNRLFIDKQPELKKIVSDILRKADFNISNIIIERKRNHLWSDEKENSSSYSPNDKILLYTSAEVKFEHTVKHKPYFLPFDQESQGTQRYYGFAGILYLLIKNSTAFPIDELEASLHPDLFIHFILSFLVNAKKSQIIATTHNREILNNKDIFRNDAIWFTDKDNENCATELYSLADFDTKIIRDTSNIFNAYKLGRLGGTPNLGDYYIAIEEDEK